MAEAILAFFAADMLFSLISIKIPLFRRNSKRWEEETGFQRFCNSFFVPMIGFAVCILILNYKDANAPSRIEKMLESGETDYGLITDVDKIGDADIVYEIKRGLNENEICGIIKKIGTELGKGNDLNVFFRKGEYKVSTQNAAIGTVIPLEKKNGVFLYFKWEV